MIKDEMNNFAVFVVVIIVVIYLFVHYDFNSTNQSSVKTSNNGEMSYSCHNAVKDYDNEAQKTYKKEAGYDVHTNSHFSIKDNKCYVAIQINYSNQDLLPTMTLEAENYREDLFYFKVIDAFDNKIILECGAGVNNGEVKNGCSTGGTFYDTTFQNFYYNKYMNN